MQGPALTYYEATARGRTPRPALTGARTADVAVVGGGLTGVSAALHLAERGARVVLLEAAQIGAGASGRNGGQVHSGQRQDQDSLERRFGATRARLLWDLAEEAKGDIRERIARHAMSCAPQSGVLTAAHRVAHAPQLRAYGALLTERYGYAQTRYLDRDELAARLGTARYCGGLLDEGAFHLHPLNLLLGLAQAAESAGAMLYEDSRVLTLDRARPYVLRTAEGEVRAHDVVLAADSWMGALAPELGAKTVAIANFVGVTEILGEAGARGLIRDLWAVADTKFVLDYYRITEDFRLLFGGGEAYLQLDPPDVAAIVRRPMTAVFPQLADTRIDYAWSGRVGVTGTRAPDLGVLQPGLWYAHGYSGHGLAIAVLAGKLISEAMSAPSGRFEAMAAFAPPRLPGGRLLRGPAMTLALAAARLWDRL